jgi:hypothetical protein
VPEKFFRLNTYKLLHRSARNWFGYCWPRHIARPVNTVVSLPQSDKRMLPLLQVSGETDAIDITLALTFCFVFSWRYHAVTLTSR